MTSISPRLRLVAEGIRAGKSYSEIGNSLGISKQAAHKLAGAAINTLREKLEAMGFQGLDTLGLLKSICCVSPQTVLDASRFLSSPQAQTMIQSFADKDTQELFQRETNRRFTAISRVALRKLIQMNRARVLQDLAIPPGNRLEALKGNLVGYHSIRINDQWRIVFAWTEHGPAEVRICDYH